MKSGIKKLRRLAKRFVDLPHHHAILWHIIPGSSKIRFGGGHMFSGGIVFIVVALVLYTIVIFSEKKAGCLSLWMIIMFSGAFMSDLLGTFLMFFTNRAVTVSAARFPLHVAFGYAALSIMFLHLMWAFLAIDRRGRWEKLFRRYSVYAWLLWLCAFFSGIPY